MEIKKFLIAMFIPLLILSACQKETVEPLQLIIGQASEPGRLNPLLIKSPETFFVAWQLYEGLLGLDSKGQIIPKIAESWETEDFRIWTFKIRKGVHFHSSEIFGVPSTSREVTARDVYYSYTRFCSPEAYPSFLLADSVKGFSEFSKGEADSVEGFRVIDDFTFQIELVEPERFFLNRISSPWLSIFPMEAEKDVYKDRWGLDLVIGTGPFVLKTNTKNEIILKKNTDYWDTTNRPNVDEVIVKVIKNDQIRFANLEKGLINMMAVPSQMFSTVFDSNGTPLTKYESQFGFTALKTFNCHFIGINLNAITDVHLRRAMNIGTNRDEMINTILSGNAEPLGGVTPPGMNGYQSPFETRSDLVRAKQEMAKSSYDGREISLLVHELADSELIGQLFQKQMSDIGINIRLEKQNFNSIISRMIKGETELFSSFAEIAFSSPEPLLINLFSSKKIPVPNFWHYSDPSIDQRLEDLKTISDKNTSIRQAELIEKEIMEACPAIFLYQQKQVYMYSKKFQGVKINGHGHFMLEDIKPAEE